jgi:hypothetical protein
MSQTYTVNVTRKHLCGDVWDSHDCPISRAVSSATKKKAIFGTRFGTVGVEPFTVPPLVVYKFETFSKFPVWLRLIFVRPFSFELTIPS